MYLCADSPLIVSEKKTFLSATVHVFSLGEGLSRIPGMSGHVSIFLFKIVRAIFNASDKIILSVKPWPLYSRVKHLTT